MTRLEENKGVLRASKRMSLEQLNDLERYGWRLKDGPENKVFWRARDTKNVQFGVEYVFTKK